MKLLMMNEMNADEVSQLRYSFLIRHDVEVAIPVEYE
jgi:hypothetical protein